MNCSPTRYEIVYINHQHSIWAILASILMILSVVFDVPVSEAGFVAFFFQGGVQQPGVGDGAVLAAGAADGNLNGVF